jgi:hypothetical protein
MPPVEPCPDCNPSLPTVGAPAAYVDVFVDYFVGLAQKHKNCVWRTLLEAVDEVFWPLSPSESPTRQEPVSIKKLLEGDGSWSTIKLVLGWILDLESLTICLPPHCVERLWEILDKIPPTQRWISIKKWHKVLGELRSVSLALPGSRNIFSTMQNALALKTGGHLALDKGVTMPLRTSGGCRKTSAPAPLGLQRLCLSRQLPKGTPTLWDWALAGFGFPVHTLPPVLVSLLHSFLYGGTNGQILSPLGW